jgi:hypothetical protein
MEEGMNAHRLSTGELVIESNDVEAVLSTLAPPERSALETAVRESEARRADRRAAEYRKADRIATVLLVAAGVGGFALALGIGALIARIIFRLFGGST